MRTFNNCGEHAAFFERLKMPGDRVYGEGSVWYITAFEDPEHWEMSDGPYKSVHSARRSLAAIELAERLEYGEGFDVDDEGQVDAYEVADQIRKLASFDL